GAAAGGAARAAGERATRASARASAVAARATRQRAAGPAARVLAAVGGGGAAAAVQAGHQLAARRGEGRRQPDGAPPHQRAPSRSPTSRGLSARCHRRPALSCPSSPEVRNRYPAAPAASSPAPKATSETTAAECACWSRL